MLCCCSVTKSCLTLCDPMDCSLPGSSFHGIFQARILEWVAMSSSNLSSVIQLLGRVGLFVTSWTAAHQASLFTNSQSLFKFMSIESVMPFNHLVLHPFLLLPSIFPSIRVFSNKSVMSWLFTSGGQSIGTSASVLPKNVQNWFSLGLTRLISLQSKGL